MAHWTAIVLTCQNEQSAHAYQKELAVQQEKGYIPKDVILLTVADPMSKVGSGGATLNALLVVAEYISAKQGFTGRSFPLDSSGSCAFVTLPMTQCDADRADGLVCNLDLLLETLTHKMASITSTGVWVCSTDMFLNVAESLDAEFIQSCDACLVTVPAAISYAVDHGVCKVNQEGYIEDILYKCNCEETLKTCALSSGQVPLVSGVVYFNSRVADRLLACHVLPPLDCCTYLGIDSGSNPICISLFFDVMLAMCQGMTDTQFIERNCVAASCGDGELVSSARRLIWKHLGSFKVKSALVNGEHSYMNLQPRNHYDHLQRTVCNSSIFKYSLRSHSYTSSQALVAGDCTLINSIVEAGARIGSGTVLTHCHLTSPISVGKRSIISGLHDDDITVVNAELLDDVVYQILNVRLNNLSRPVSHRVHILFGTGDNLQAATTFCGNDFALFLSRTGIKSSDLWDETVPEVNRSLLNARLYPVLHLSRINIGFEESLWLQGRVNDDMCSVILQRWRSAWRMSMEEILSSLDIATELQSRRELFFAVGKSVMCDTLLNGREIGLNSLYKSAVIEGFAEYICTALDSIGGRCGSAGTAARILANLADVIGAMSRGNGGLRSGPASNRQWETAFRLLENEEISQGFLAMATERKNWLTQPSHLVRAARHYEGATQILIRHAVMTARQFIRTKDCDPSPMLKWVVAECPARVDVAGGWSDTPPITYEHGGAVVDVAITVDGKKPVGAKVRRIEKLHIVINFEEGGQLVVSELSDLRDYNQPHAPGALHKAAIVCTKVVDFPSDIPLEVQLREKYGSGFEVSTWSNLPHGSGMGTSSILAGALMAVLWRASGKQFDIDSLNHAVLHLEQMLTTGGGWQDQVGGLTPGIKIGHSKAELPVRIELKFLSVDDGTVNSFGDQLVLVYTGKTRLAKNLLQNVVRNWYARNPLIVETENQLVDNAWKCANAFEQGDLAAVGKCMSHYWSLKKIMAPGCEPELVVRMMAALEPHILGMSMAGAGGGGFMYLLTKQPHFVDNIRDILRTVQGAEDIQVCKAAVDATGLVLTIEGTGQEHVPFSFE